MGYIVMYKTRKDNKWKETHFASRGAAENDAAQIRKDPYFIKKSIAVLTDRGAVPRKRNNTSGNTSGGLLSGNFNFRGF